MVREGKIVETCAEAEKTPVNLSVTFSNLRENAVYLGTERLLDVLEDYDAAGVPDSSFNGLLLRELRRVQDALTTGL